MAFPLSKPQLRGTYFPAVDGLRTVAILGVFLHHSFGYLYPAGMAWWGWCGVDLFFVISGFLITGILYDAKQKPHFFSNFYLRRALRIFPLYYGVWLALLALSVFVRATWRPWHLLGLLYLQNFEPFLMPHWSGTPAELTTITFGPLFGRSVAVSLYHFWSLCIEEQFYLVWPFVVWSLGRKQLLRLCVACMMLVPLLRLYLVLHAASRNQHFQLIYTSTFTRFDTLLAGAALALWLRGNPAFSTAAIRKFAVAAIAACFTALVAGHLMLDRGTVRSVEQPFLCTAGYTLIALIATALVLLALDAENLLARLLRLPPMLHLAKISYGFYVIHYLLILSAIGLSIKLQRLGLPWAGPLLLFAGTYVMAQLSYHFLERPFLRMKDRLSERKTVREREKAIS